MFRTMKSSRDRKAKVRTHNHPLSLERLEDRMLLAVRVWDGGGSDALWSNAMNWQGDLAPQGDDNLVFPAGLSGDDLVAQNDFSANTRFRTFTISGGGYDLQGNSVTLLEGVLANNPYDSLGPTKNVNTIEFSITMGAQQSFVSATANTSLVLNGTLYTGDVAGANLQATFDGHGTIQANGVITGQGTLVKNADGTLILAGDNDYAGLTQIYGGVVTLRHNHALGSAAGFTRTEAGTQLQLDGDGLTIDETLWLRGNGNWASVGTTTPGADPFDQGGGALRNLRGTNEWSGQITINTPTEIGGVVVQIGVDAGSTLKITGAMLGPHEVIGSGFNKLGSGVLELGGTAANQIIGDVYVYDGTLRLAKQDNVAAFSGNVYMGAYRGGNDSAILEVATNFQQMPQSIYTGYTLARVGVYHSGKVVLDPGVTQTIGYVDMYYGATAAADIYLDTGSTLVLSGNITATYYQQESSSDLSPAATIGGPGVLDLGQFFSGVSTGQSVAQRYINVGETYMQGEAVDLDISVKITGDAAMGLLKGGAGVLRLSGDNDYAGGTMLAGGIVELASDTAFGPGNLDIRLGYLRSTDDARTLANRIYLCDTSYFVGTKDLTLNGEVTLSGAYGGVSKTLVVLDPAMTLTMNGRVSDDFQPTSAIRSDQWYATELTKAGRGELVFTNEVSINNSVRVDYDGGTIRLKDDGRILDSRFIYIYQGGQLIIDNTGVPSAYESNRINDLADIGTRGGNLLFKGRAATASTETFGSFEAYQFFNSWIESEIGAGGSNKLLFANIRRGDQASVRFIGTGAELSADGENQVVVQNMLGAPTAGWVTGTLINGVLPFCRIEGPTSYDVATLASVDEGFAIVPFDRYVTIDASKVGTDITALVDSTSNVSITDPGTYYISSMFINSLSLGNDVILRGTSTTTNLTIQGGNLRMGDGAELAVPFVALGNPAPPGNIPGNVQTIIAVRGGRTATISGAIIGSAALMKTGNGKLVLSGTNEFSGAFDIQEGTVTAQNSAAFGASVGGVKLMFGATLELDGSGGDLLVGPEGLQLCGQGFNNFNGIVEAGEDQGAIRSIAGNNSWAGTVYQNWPIDSTVTDYYDGYAYFGSNNAILANATFYRVDAGSLALRGQIMGDAETIKLGPGQLELGGSQQNLPSLGMRVKEGTLLLNKAAGVGTYRGSPIYVGDDDPATAPAILRLGADEQIFDGAGVRVMSDGQWDLAGHRESINYVELVTSDLGAGTINIGDGGNLIFQVGANNGITVFNLGLTGTTGARVDGGTLSLNYPLQGTINRSIVVGDTAAETDLTITSAIKDNTGIGFTNLYKFGWGTLELGGTEPNTYSGLTRVYEGTLVFNKPDGVAAIGGALYVGDESFSGGGKWSDVARWKHSDQIPDFYALVYVYNSGILDLAGNNETLGLAPLQEGLRVYGGGVVDTGGGRLTVNGNIYIPQSGVGDVALILGGELRLGSGVGEVAHYINVDNWGAFPYELQISSNITGEATAPLFKQGDGGMLLTGHNTYAGDTFILNATSNPIAVATDSPFGSGMVSLGNGSLVSEGLNPADGTPWKVTNRVSLDGTVYFGASANTRADSQSFAGGWYDLELAGPLALTSNRTIFVGFPVNVTISGDIGELYGQMALYKSSPGFLTLTGTDWQSGALVVNTGGGSLILKDQGHVENASQIAVYDGGSLILNDTGIQSTDRIDDRIPLNLYGGTLQFGNNRNAPTSETLGIVTIGGGISPATIRSAAVDTSQARITIERLNPAATYSYMEFSGGGRPLGSPQNQIKVLDNNLPTLVGSPGKEILGWGFISSPDGGTDFVTYDPAAGFKAQTNYVTSMAAAGPDDNVMLSAATDSIDSNRSINALMIEGPGTTLSQTGGDWTLLINSGALFTGAGLAATATHNINVAVLDLEGDANLLTRKGTTTNYNTSIRSNALAIAGKGETVLAGDNQQIGMTLITEGITTATHPNAFGTIAADTRVYMGAVLQLQNVAIGNETLRMYSPGYGTGAFDNRGGVRAIGGGTSSWGTGTTTIQFATSGSSGYGLTAYLGATAGSTLNFNGTITATSVPMYKVDAGTLVYSGTASTIGDNPLYVNAGTVAFNKTAGMNAVPTTIYVGDDIGGDDADRLVLYQSNQIPNTAVLAIYTTGLFDMNGQNEEWIPTAAATVNDVLRLYIGPTAAGDIDLHGGTLTLTNGNNISADVSEWQRYGGGPVGARIYNTGLGGSLTLNKNGTPATMLGTRFYVDNTAAIDDLTVSAVIADGAGAGTLITKDMTYPAAARTYTNMYGRMLFSGANTFTGAVTVNAGELAISSPTGLGNATTGTQVTGGAALILEGGVTVNGEPLTIFDRGLGFNETGALRSLSGNNAFNGPVTLGVTTGQAVRVGVDRDTLTLGGILGGTGSMVKNLDGTLELAGASSNTAIGSFYVWQGTMILNKTGTATAFGTGANLVYIGNNYGPIGGDLLQYGSLAGTDQLPVGTRVELQSGGKMDLNGKTDALSTTSGWVLHQYINYSTQTPITGGTITLSGTQTLRTDGTGNYSPWSPAPEIAANLSLAAGTAVIFDVVDGITRYDLLISGNVTGTGTTNLSKTESGALWMTGTNSYVGSITLNSGTLVVSNASQLGAGTNPIIFNNSDNARAVASIRAEGGPITIPNPLTLQGAGLYAGILGREALTFTGNITVAAAVNGTFRLRVSNYGLTTFTGNVSYTNNNVILAVEPMFASTVEMTGVISDGGGLGGNFDHLQKDGHGTLILEGANTYEGTTTINLGILRITNPQALGQSVTPVGYTYIVAGGTLELDGDGMTIDENFRAYGMGFASIIQTGLIRMRDYRPGANDTNTLTGNVNIATVPGIYVGVDGAEDYLRMGGDGVISSSEMQLLTVTAASGTYSLTFDVDYLPANGGGPMVPATTANLNWNATAAEIKNALEALLPIGGIGGKIDVVKDPNRNTYMIYFRGSLDNVNLQVMTVNPATAASIVELNNGGLYPVYKVGPGMLRLTGNGANTYGGGTFINEGTLRLNMTEGPASTYATGKGNIVIGDEGGGPDADRLMIAPGSNHDQIPDYAGVIVAGSGLFDLATEPHDATIGSLIMTHSLGQSGHVATGTSTLTLAGGTAAVPPTLMPYLLASFPTYPTLGVINFGATTAADPAPVIDGHLHFATEAPVITVNDTLLPSPADDLVVTAEISSDAPMYDPASGTYYTSGLREGRLPSAFDETNLNPGSCITSSPRMAETVSTYLTSATTTTLPSLNPDTPTWSTYETYVYSGRFYDADGKFTFAENVDDYTSIILDGQRILRSTSGTQITTTGTNWYRTGNTFAANANLYGTRTNFGMGPNGDGWHDIEIRLYNGAGLGGSTQDTTNHWTYETGKLFTYGLRYNPNEVQTISFSTSAGSGTFTLNFNGETTGPITYNSNPSSMVAGVKSALEALSTVNPNTVNVYTAVGGASGVNGAPGLVVEFTGALANTNVLLGGASYVTSNTLSFFETAWDGQAFQRILDPGDGSLLRTPAEATFNGKGTLALQGTNSLTLPLVVSDGKVKLSDGGSVLHAPSWTVKPGAALEVAPDAAPLSEVQKLAFSTTPATDTWTLSFDSGADTTNLMAWSATAAEVQAELENLPSIGPGSVAVTGSYTAGFVFTFQGYLSGMGIEMLQADTSALNGGGGVIASITEITTALNLAGGTVTVDGAAGGGVGHYVNGVTAKAGTASTLEIAPDATGLQSTSLTAATLVREAGGTVIFQGTNADLGDGVADLRLLSFTGDAGGIEPFATVVGPAGIDLLTDVDVINSDYVIGRWAATDYETDLNALVPVSDNYRISTAQVLTGPKIVNALVLDNGATVDLAGYTLTVTSGLITSTSGAVVIDDTVGGGTVAFGSAEARLVVAGTSLQFDAPITGTGDLRKQGSGRLVLTTDNSGFSGAIAVDQGVLRITNNNALGAVTAGTTVSTGAALEIDPQLGTFSLPTVNETQTIYLRTNEQQKIKFVTTGATAPTSGLWTVTLDPDGTGPIAAQSTVPLSYSTTAAVVQAELQALPVIGAGNVFVAGTMFGGFQIVFAGTLAGIDVQDLVADASSLVPATSVQTPVELVKGGLVSPPANEVQTLVFNPTMPTAGTYSLTFDPDGTGPILPQTATNIASTATAATVQAALQGLTTIGAGNVTVSGAYNNGGFVIAFTGVLSATDMPDDVLSLTNLTLAPAGISGAVGVATQGGAAAFNETQAFWFNAPPTTGTYFLTFNNVSTGNLNWSDSAATVQSALENVSTIGSGNVQVVGNQNAGFVVTFLGGLGGQDLTNAGVTVPVAGMLPGLIVTGGTTTKTGVYGIYREGGRNLAGTWTANVRGTATGAIPWNASALQVQNALETLYTIGSQVNEVQQIVFASAPPTGGTYTITFRGATTGPLAYDADAATVQAALGALSSIGPDNVVVTGAYNAGGFLLSWQNEVAAVGITDTDLTFDLRSLSPVPAVAVGTATAGAYGAYNETQAISITGATGGTWSISFKDATSTAIAWSATAATVQSAIQAMPTVGLNNAAVIGDYRTGFQITFLNQYALANPVHGSDQPEMTINTGALLGSPANTVTTLRNATSPLPNFSVAGDYTTGYAITFMGKLAGVDLPPIIVANSLLPNTPAAYVVPTPVETTKGAAEMITLSGVGPDGSGALRALPGTTELNNTIRLNAVSPAAFPGNWILPNQPYNVGTITNWTTLNVQSVGMDPDATLILNGRITQQLNPASLAKVGEGTLEVGGVTLNSGGYDVFLNDIAYEGFTFLNSGTTRMNKLIPNGAFSTNWMYVGDNEGGREVDRLVYPDGALANQCGSALFVWRSGQMDFNGRGDDVGDFRIIDAKVFGGRSVGSVLTLQPLRMYGGLLDIESTNTVVTGVYSYYGPQAVVNASGTGGLNVTTGARVFEIADGSSMYDMIINAPIQGGAGSQLNKTNTGALLLNGDNSFTGTNEVHTVIIPGSVRTFTVSYNGQTTPLISTAGLTTGALQTALEALPAIAQGSLRLTGGANEIQALAFSVNPTGGTYKLSFRGFTTVPIAYSATAATVATELVKLPSITAAANIAVGGAYNTGGFTFTFQGLLAATDVDTLTADTSTLTPAGIAGVPYEALKGGTLLPTYEVQQFAFNDVLPVTGNYTLSFRGAATANIAYNDTAATVQARLQALFTIGSGNVLVSGAYNQGGFAITFRGVLAGLNIADDDLVFNAGTTGVTAAITTATNGGDAGFNETQEVYFSAPTGGNWTLTFNSQVTASIAWNATAAEVRSRLEALSGIGAGNVAVVGSYQSGYQVTFLGNLRGVNQNALTITTTALLPAGRTGAVVTLREGSTATATTIAFVNNLAGADVSQETYTVIAGPGTITGYTLTAGVWGAQMSAGTIALGHDNALGLGGLNVANTTGGLNALWAAGGDRKVKRLVSLANNLFAMGGRREWGGTYDVWLSTAQLSYNMGSGTTGTGTTIYVDDADVDAKIGFVNEIQQITLLVATSSGSWTLAFNGETTYPLAWNATPLMVEQALSALSTIKDYGGVTGGGSVSVLNPGVATIYNVMFQGTLGAQDVPLLLDAQPTVSTAQRPYVAEVTKGSAIGGSIAELSSTFGGRFLTKLGPGRLIIGAESSYTGNTYVGTSYANTLGGRLRLQNNNALGVGFGTVVDVQGNAALELDGTYKDVVIGGKYLILRVSTDHGFASGFMNDMTGALRSISGDTTWTGDVDLRNYETSDRWVFIGADAGNMTLSGEITGTDASANFRSTMALAKTGAGKVTFAGWGSNTLTGNVLLADGTLSLKSGAMGINGLGTGNMFYLGDHTTGTGRDVLELGGIEQVHDNINLQIGKTGKIVTLPEMNTQTSREVQKIAFTGTPTGGTFCLIFDADASGPAAPQVTAALPWNATAAQVEMALNALPILADTGGYVRVLNADVVGQAYDSYYVAFRGNLGGLDIDNNTLGYLNGLTGATPGITISELTQGGQTETVANSEVQYWAATVASGTLSFRGNTTPAIANTAQPAVIEAALNALPSISANGGYVRVNGAPGSTNAATAGAYWITFLGTLSGEPMPNLVASTGTMYEVSRGGMGPVETLDSGGTADILAYLGDTSSADIELAAGTSVALGRNLVYRVFPGITTGTPAHISGPGELGLMSALQTMTATRIITLDDGPADEDLIVTATVSDGRSGIQANLQKDGAGSPRMVFDPMSDANTFTGITTVNSGFLNIRSNDALGSAKTNEVQRVTLSVTPTGGTWTITFDGDTTVPLRFDAAPGEVREALNALPSIASRGGRVRVTNYSSSRDFVITFLDGMGGSNWSENVFTANTSALTPATTATIVNQAQGGIRLGTVVNSGFTLELEGGVTVTDEPLSLTGAGRLIGPLTYYGQTVIGTGALRAVSGENTWTATTVANLITPAGDTTYNADADARLRLAASVNAATRLLYKTGAGEVEITSPNGLNTTYTGTGATFVNEGVLVLNKPANLANEVQRMSLGLTDEQQRVTFSITNPASGSWSLRFEGQTTALLAFNASATAVRDALAALTTVNGPLNVDVQGSIAAGFTVTFINACGDVSYANMTVASNTLSPATTVGVTEIRAGGAAVPANSTYTMLFNGQTTWPLRWNATPAQVQMALEVLPTVGPGNVAVTGTAGGDMTLTFQSFLGNADLPQGTGTAGLFTLAYVSPAATVVSAPAVETVKGVGDELQIVTMNANPSGGYFVLTYNSQPSIPIPYNADAATVQAALEGISAVGAGNVQVMGGPLTAVSPFTVRFKGLLGQADVNTMGAAQALLGGTTIGVAETAKGGYTAIGQSLGISTVYIGDAMGGSGTLRYGPDSSGNAIPDTGAISVLPNGILDLATNGKSERIATLWLGVGGSSSAQVFTGSGTLALNPTGDTTGYFTMTYVDGGTAWNPATISGNLDLASPQMPRTRRWFKVMDSPAQAELLVSANLLGQGGLEKSGQGIMILAGNNTYTGDTILNEGTLIAASATAFGAPADGTTVEWGASLGFAGGINYTGAEPVTLASGGATSFVGGTDVATPVLFNYSDDNTFAGPITVNYPGTFASMTTGDTLTLSGSITLNATLEIDGAGDTLLAGPISGGPDGWQPGLLEGRFIGSTSGTTALFDETFVNTGTGGVKLTPAAGEIASTPPWSDHMGYVYTGQFYDSDGVFTFAENIDDGVEVKIDGIARLRNYTGTTPSTTGYVGLNSDNPFGAVNTLVNYGMGPAGDGWHEIEIRFYNATGSAGAVGNNFWSTLKGFGIDRNTINTNILGNAYMIPADPGDMSLFRTRVSSGNSLTKRGSGTLTLGGDNTYTGPTTVVQGTLRVDGTTGTGAVDVQTGATLGGNGGIVKGTLTVDAGAYLGPGAGAGRLTVNADTTLTSGSTFTVDINGTAAGTDHDQIVQNGQIHLNGANLQVNVGYTPSAADRYVLVSNDGTEPIDGIFAGLANHSIVNIGGHDFRIFYDGGDGNDVVLVKTAPLDVSTIQYGTGETQRVAFGTTPASGTWSLSFDGATTAALDWNATAAQVRTALEALPTVGSGNVLVAAIGTDGKTLVVTFTGRLSVGDQPALVPNTDTLLDDVGTPITATVTENEGVWYPGYLAPTPHGGSLISQIVVTFNGLVDTMDLTGALTVAQHANGGTLNPLNVSYTQSQIGEATQVVLTLASSGGYTYQRPALSGQYALNDNNYQLNVDSTKVHSATGDMSANTVDEFYRWFGDSDSDRDTDGTDIYAFRRVRAGDPAYDQYRSAFDYNGDGQVDTTDNNAFTTRYGRRLLPPT